MSLGRHLAYARYVLRHKWFVFVAGWRLGIPLLAALHDNSKFLPDEWRWYARHFYAPDGTKQTWQGKDGFYVDPDNDTKFDRAWLKHIRRNKHHPQHYLWCGACGTMASECERCHPPGAITRALRGCVSVCAAVLSVPFRTSRKSAGENRSTGAISAMSTGTNTSASRKTGTGRISTSAAVPFIERTLSASDPNVKKSGDGCASESWPLTAGHAFAAENGPTNSSPSITSMAGAPNTARSVAGSTASTDGSPGTGSHQTSEFSATTATAPWDITGTARTPGACSSHALGCICDVLLKDDGGAQCMSCLKKMDRSQLRYDIQEMPVRYRRELLADWIGAGLAQGTPDTLGWYAARGKNHPLGSSTRTWIEWRLGYEGEPRP